MATATATKRPNVAGMIRRLPKSLERLNAAREKINEAFQSHLELVNEIVAAQEQVGQAGGNGTPATATSRSAAGATTSGGTA